MDFIEVEAKTVEEAITEALIKLETTSDKIEYEVIEKGGSGLLGFRFKKAKIRARRKINIEDIVYDFLTKVFDAMELDANITIDIDEEEKFISVDLKGKEMGVLIGKRGQTLDSLQYLLSLVVNKEKESYYKVKIDTENYRARRKQTLENLARNVAGKVKRTKRSVSLEPMNPYERRVIHSALQNDKFVTTKSEGEEPYRKIVVIFKK